MYRNWHSGQASPFAPPGTPSGVFRAQLPQAQIQIAPPAQSAPLPLTQVFNVPPPAIEQQMFPYFPPPVPSIETSPYNPPPVVIQDCNNPLYMVCLLREWSHMIYILSQTMSQDEVGSYISYLLNDQQTMQAFLSHSYWSKYECITREIRKLLGA